MNLHNDRSILNQPQQLYPMKMDTTFKLPKFNTEFGQQKYTYGDPNQECEIAVKNENNVLPVKASH